jgi:pyruvate/2-oxoglutarate dehydrogenase complex dihydrolipoamide dehydrogenase (E3) component
MSPNKIFRNNDELNIVFDEYELTNEKDSTGKNKIKKTNSYYTEKFDYVITAIGQNVDLDFIDTAQFTIDDDFFIKDKSNRSENLFIIGDAINKDRTAVNAVASAKKVVDIITNDLNKSCCLKQNHLHKRIKNFTKMTNNGNNKLIKTEFEVLQEAKHCMSCGICSNVKKH